MKKIILLAAVIGHTFVLFAQTQKQLENMFSTLSKRDTTIETYLINNQISNVKATPDGIYYVIEQAGSGEKAKSGDYVKVHYRGKLLDGKQFDASYDRNEPIEFQLGKNRVIQGWEKGIQLFAKGGKGTLYLPSSLAYGERAVGSIIPANAVLMFDIEIVDITTEQAYNERMKAKQLRDQAVADSLSAFQREKDVQVINKYLTDKSLKATILPNGLAYIIERPGEGPNIAPGKNATVHYAGYLLDGKKFDASYDRNQPFTLTVGVGQVIPGWDEGLQLINKGGKIKLIIPSTMGYGQGGAGGVIPPNAVLIFDVEVLDIK